MSKPEFSFMANSAVDPDDKSGVAVWRYTRFNGTCLEKETICRQHFDSFAEAAAINDLIRYAYHAGIRDGGERVCDAVDRSLSEYR